MLPERSWVPTFFDIGEWQASWVELNRLQVMAMLWAAICSMFKRAVSPNPTRFGAP